MTDLDPRAVEAVMDVARRDGFLGDDPDDWRDVREQVVRELEAAAPYLYAQALRELANTLNEYAKVSYAEGEDKEARGYVVARVLATDRADELEKS